MPYVKIGDFDHDLQDPVVRRPGCMTLLWIVLIVAVALMAWGRFDK